MESQIHPSGARRFRGICTGLICSVLLLTAAAYAFLTIFGKFAFYDDEGFLMITVQGFLKGKPLYDNVFTIYGPFFNSWVYIFAIPTSLGLCACTLVANGASRLGGLSLEWRAWMATGVGALGFCAAQTPPFGTWCAVFVTRNTIVPGESLF